MFCPRLFTDNFRFTPETPRRTTIPVAWRLSLSVWPSRVCAVQKRLNWSRSEWDSWEHIVLDEVSISARRSIRPLSIYFMATCWCCSVTVHWSWDSCIRCRSHHRILVSNFDALCITFPFFAGYLMVWHCRPKVLRISLSYLSSIK